MSIKLDLHLHSKSRGKIFIDSFQLRNSLRKNLLDGVAITNFFDVSHALELKRELQEYIIIVGQEVWTKDGHIIGLGLKERIPDLLSAQETVKHIHGQGGVAVAPHPYSFLGVKEKVQSLEIDAIESYNALMGASIVYNYLAEIAGKRMEVTQTASTDTSDAKFIGYSYTEVFMNNGDSVLENIRLGRVKLYKRALPVPFAFIFKNLLNFKNIEPCLLHPVPCLVCRKSMATRIFKTRVRCLDCGSVQWSRILCSNGHYLCLECIIKRNSVLNRKEPNQLCEINNVLTE